MAEERMRLPSGSGGLTRYFEDYKSNFQISPGHVIALTIIVTIIILLLHQFGPAFLG